MAKIYIYMSLVIMAGKLLMQPVADIIVLYKWPLVLSWCDKKKVKEKYVCSTLSETPKIQQAEQN